MTGRPVPAAVLERRPRRGAGALRDRRRGALPAGGRRQPGRALDQLRRGRGVRRAAAGATSTSSTSAAGATSRSWGAARPTLRTASATRCSPTSPTSATCSPPATWCVGRSGGSIFELTAAGRPAILVPYPHATADHQSGNAAWMAAAGAATVIADAELSGGRLAAEVGALLGDPERLAGMAAASRGAGQARRGRPDRRPGPRGGGPGAGSAMSGLEWLGGGCTSSASAAPG